MSLQIVKGIENFKPVSENGIVTIGTFDGVHRGHQAILSKLNYWSEKDKLLSLAVTFEPHPRVLVTPDTPPPLLTAWEEKVELFGRYFNGHLLVLEFNRQLMNMTAEEFIENFLVKKIGLRKLIVGYDHAFGKNRSGTINDLMGLSRKYSFSLEIVDPVIVDGKPISSSRIRRAMLEGNFVEATFMLGHSYSIFGTVKKGMGLGRKLGFPTANLEVSSRKLLPPEGVYSCSILSAGIKYDGMMFIGTNHFNPGAGVSVEANIFKFDRQIYGEEIYIFPENYLREGRIYKNTEDLITQIKIDRENAIRMKNKGEIGNAS